jgi:HlyD family secretion protein
VAAARAQLAAARLKLDAVQNPRPEDIAAAQAALDQQRTRLAQLLDAPRTRAEDIASADAAVAQAQAGVDRAMNDSTGVNANPAVKDATIRQAQAALAIAQNNLLKVKSQPASDWDARLLQEQVAQAEANLDRLRHPAPADVEAAQAAVAQAQASLARLEAPLAGDVDALQAAVDQAQANLDKLRTVSDFDVQVAQSAVDAAQANVDKLLAVNDFDVQAAAAAVDQAQAALDRAQAAADKARRAQAGDVDAAQAQLEQAQANLDVKQAGPAAQDIAVAEAQVVVAQAALDQAKWALGNATLAAPFDGVVAAVNAGPGEIAGTANAVVTLVGRSAARADVVVDENDVARIKAGQPATLIFDKAPGRTASGQVASIVPMPSVQQGIVNYVVQIALSGASDATLLPGMSTQAQIVTDRRENALLVPGRAIHSSGKDRVVDVVDSSGKLTARPVKLGITGPELAEIVDGLREGDRIAVPLTFGR